MSELDVGLLIILLFEAICFVALSVGLWRELKR